MEKEIKKHLPDFELSYNVDPVRQAIADSWPNSMDDSCARDEWDWKPDYEPRRHDCRYVETVENQTR